ncbi:MAG: RusA family crossover junction endodeoxyribonuclease [Candidatus Peribacteraceae bacterium]|nr:RusA family crossover junction endodeoxyribonuclease [Candidatus Peribacteraceae bacterium]
MGYKKFVIDPKGKPRMVRSDAWSKRSCVERYWAYKEELNEQRETFCLQDHGMDISFYIPMPKSWSKKKKAEHLFGPHKQKPDIDNLLKAFFDCLTDDDSSIYSVKVHKFWAHEGTIEVHY